jgi:carboxyl-terminal processing protease
MNKIKIILLAVLMPTAILFAKEKQVVDRNFEISKGMDIYNSLFRELDLYYVDTINPGKLMQESIDKMLEGVDPYTTYIPEEDQKDFRFMTTGEYGGVGAVISQNKKGETYISVPYEGMPAQRNGLRAGDIILEVDGNKLKGKTVSEVSELLKGEAGTMVKVTIERYGEKKPITKTFAREKIQINPVTYYGVVGDKVGYINLNQFTDKATDEVKAAIMDLKNNKQITSLIFDLRNNPGGLINDAVSISNCFLPQGVEIVSTKGKMKQWDAVYKSTESPILPTMPMVILVNGNTASASEIVSGAVQDYDRGVILGTRTYGKGLVQSTREVSYNGYLKVTTAKYYTPSGRCIQAIDYAHRDEDGNITRIPDSLTHEFKTKIGRTVKDGGGIMPDVEVKNDKKANISLYLYLDNKIFDFATQYATKHKKIDSPEEFKLTDKEYEDFKQFLKEQNFTYTLRSADQLKKLKDMIEFEGYDEILKNDLDSLQQKLVPNIDRDLELFKPDVVRLIEAEIIERYYYQKGSVRYALKEDDEVKKALEILANKEQYNQILSVKKE